MKNIVAYFIVFCLFFSCTPTGKEKKIALQPFGLMSTHTLNEIAQTLKTIYDMDIAVLEKKALPKSAFTNIKSARYRADSLIRFLKVARPDSIDIVLGLTSSDISTTKRDKNGNIKKPISRYQDWGVFGLGYRPGPSCIVSTYRIKNSSQNIFMERLKKICVHEVGHNLGLKHCIDKKCVMTDACETIKTVDKVQLALCSTCKSKL